MGSHPYIWREPFLEKILDFFFRVVFFLFGLKVEKFYPEVLRNVFFLEKCKKFFRLGDGNFIP